jgi:hypothetical protein
LEFPFNIRVRLAAWNELFLWEGPFKPDPGKSAEVNRGAYIVEGLGHCGTCHNGRNLLGDTTTLARALQGSLITHCKRRTSPPTCMTASANSPTTSLSPTSRPESRPARAWP